MKRIRSLLLILLALLLVMQLGACGSTAPAGETEQPQQETEETDEATPESAEETARTLVEQGWALAYPDSGEPDYAAARTLFEQAAELGNADALNELGLLYNDGKGVAQDYVKAREYYEQASALGSQHAMYNLAWMYENGQGVEADGKKAAELYEQAADLGSVDAMYNLGELYHDGFGVEQDYTAAVLWFRKAADLGADNAMFALGVMFKNGEGVTQDYAKAHEYYERAAECGNYMAMNNLGVLYENGQGVEYDRDTALYWYEKSDTMRHVEELRNRGWVIDQEEAMTWDLHLLSNFLCAAADGGNGQAIEDLDVLREHHNPSYLTEERVNAWADAAHARQDAAALCGIGRLYNYGNGIARDSKAAVTYYQEAAEMGNADAMIELGDYYEFDNPKEALSWYRQAADTGNVKGMQSLGFCLGFFLHQYTEGVEWLLKAEEKGDTNPGRYYLIGRWYYETKDYENALKWYMFGVEELNDGDCMFEISELYRAGKGVEKDREKADEWLARAEEVGYFHL